MGGNCPVHRPKTRSKRVPGPRLCGHGSDSNTCPKMLRPDVLLICGSRATSWYTLYASQSVAECTKVCCTVFWAQRGEMAQKPRVGPPGRPPSAKRQDQNLVSPENSAVTDWLRWKRSEKVEKSSLGSWSADRGGQHQPNRSKQVKNSQKQAKNR